MIGTLSLSIIALLAFCVCAEIARELSFKRASLGAQSNSSYALGLAAQPLLWVGIAFWAVEVIAWILVLEHARLSLAYPVMTLTYAGVPLGGALLLRERLTRVQMAGAVLVAIGVLTISVSEL
jgi:multidrug transporter EmrE-like cation transporter